MPKVNQHEENVKYYLVRKGEEPGCYQLHKYFMNLYNFLPRYFLIIFESDLFHLCRPSQCRHKLPTTNKPIHKCEIIKKKTTTIPPQVAGWRTIIIPSKKPNLYPVVMHTSDYERLKEQAKVPKCLSI